ncbi:response regulator transcription factor [Desulfosporosinus sp. BICA1-9]|uniref:response regulator transcription factor n=1 Tax=Desulfosporosinus sp. BICA1-9 TaxID=1531958 RepID=UPI00054BC1E1|nr:response regulator transcription factor [Desulfosporosinus sp. BICA1-9]KJS88471.1 MAG: ArsR family transcriptional regulator [Desulfosporosinus sp. BICA1-9]HBW34683.1 DNA-binding response regulator [Desulfosporosinus sp.]
MAKILLVEDEVQIQELVQVNLEKDGFTVINALNGEQGLELARRDKPDLIILDLTLPLIDGFDVIKTLRAQKDTQAIPIIILNASDDVMDKIIGLELGADDYLSKPFSPRELSARIKARLREVQRKTDTKDSPLRWGGLEISKESYTVTLAEEPLNLTVKEFELLVLFVTNPYQVFSREYLIQKIWGNLSGTGTRALDVHISHLRNKLKSLGPVLDSVRGVGYTFVRRV